MNVAVRFVTSMLPLPPCATVLGESVGLPKGNQPDTPLSKVPFVTTFGPSGSPIVRSAASSMRISTPAGGPCTYRIASVMVQSGSVSVAAGGGEASFCGVAGGGGGQGGACP